MQSKTVPASAFKSPAKETPLLSKIKNIIIQNNNFLDFEQYQQLCLYDPEYGYYSNAYNSFDINGDFITAPYYSELFGHCIARFCYDRHNKLNSENFNILELGPGTGLLASQILDYYINNSIQISNYYLLDISPKLIERQKKLLLNKYKDYSKKIHWIEQIPQDFVGVIIGNEVLDAIPVRLFNWIPDKRQFFELGVGLDPDQNLCWQYKTPNPVLKKYLNNFDFSNYPEYISEANILLEQFIKNITQQLKHASILLIDYGHQESNYYNIDRTTGTLRTYSKHNATDNPLLAPGQQDISCHVNWSLLVKLAKSNNWNLVNHSSQANFLIQNGLIELLAKTDDNARKQVWPLISPNVMGEAIQVMEFNFHSPE